MRSGPGTNHEVVTQAQYGELLKTLEKRGDWVRVEGFAFAHVADEGIIQSSAASLLRFRRHIGAERVQVWADVKKKHASHAITADVGIGEAAAAAEFMRADAVIVTGTATGESPTEADVAEVRGRCAVPVYLGSGITEENLPRYFAGADGFIVGSAFKSGGRWDAGVDAARVAIVATSFATFTGAFSRTMSDASLRTIATGVVPGASVTTHTEPDHFAAGVIAARRGALSESCFACSAVEIVVMLWRCSGVRPAGIWMITGMDPIRRGSDSMCFSRRNSTPSNGMPFFCA